MISRGGLALIRKTLKGGTLRELSLRNTLLIEEGSAEVLLSFLCESREANCSSPIRALDLSNTNIRVRELESFLLALDTSALRSLKMGNRQLTQTKSPSSSTTALRRSTTEPSEHSRGVLWVCSRN